VFITLTMGRNHGECHPLIGLIVKIIWMWLGHNAIVLRPEGLFACP
jgi:hypothetical protein